MWSITPTPGLILVFDGALAIENLVGQLLGFGLIIWAIWAGGSFLSRRLRGRTETASLPSPVPPSPDISAPLNMLKEELFTLESNRMLGKITAEQYANDRASLEARLKLASREEASDHIPAVPSEPQQQRAPIASGPENRFSPWFLIPLLAFPGFAASMTLSRYGLSAESAGYWIGTLLVPFLVAYAIAGAKRRRNWERFTVWFFVLGILLWGASTQKSLTSLSRSDMTKELVGAKPLESNLPPNETEMANATRALFADISAMRKSHDEQVDALAPDLALVYTAESFSSKAAMQRCVDVVDKHLTLDLQASDMLKQLPEMARNRISQTNLSEREREEFITAFTKSFNGSAFLPARNQATADDSDWVDSIHDLYGYAILHASQIATNKDSITIASDPIRESFNEKLTRSKEMYDKYLAAAKKSDELRAAVMRNSGVSDADLGAAK